MNSGDSVSFYKPDGTLWTDAGAISGNETASAVEVLHINNVTGTDIGTWQVKLIAPPSRSPSW